VAAAEIDPFMTHDEPILIVRRKPPTDGNDIPLGQWLSYVETSSIVHTQPPVERRGINPFTKQPIVLRPAPGGAFFDGPRGRCKIEYHAGGLIVRGAVGHAEAIVAQIAEALDADVETYIQPC